MTAGSLLVVAGEASGDLHGSRLVAELLRRAPDIEVFGLGGDELQRVGMHSLGHSREIAVVGITEAARVLRRARQIFHALLREVEARSPRAAVLIDSPEFNLRLAPELKRRGVPVVYYISPQVWAWRQGRIRTIARCVDRLLVLFPFEVGFYRQHGVVAIHVGHPLVDEVPELKTAWDEAGGEGLARGQPLRLALLPGSRDSEVRALLGPMLQAIDRLAATRPIEVTLIRAPTVSRPLTEELLGRAATRVRLADDDRFAAIARSHLALCASGTATLEVGLLGTPMIVLYRVAPLTYLLARMLVRVPHVALVNLVLGGGIVPELLQGAATAARIAGEVESLLAEPERLALQRRRFAGLRAALGEGGASRRAAEEVLRLVGLP